MKIRSIVTLHFSTFSPNSMLGLFANLVLGRADAWAQLEASWPYSEVALFIFVMALAHEIAFIPTNLFFAACDHMGWLQQYRLPRKGKRPPPELMKRTLIELFVALYVARWGILWMMYYPMKSKFFWPLVCAGACACVVDGAHRSSSAMTVRCAQKPSGERTRHTIVLASDQMQWMYSCSGEKMETWKQALCYVCACVM